MNPRKSNWIKLASLILITVVMFTGCAKRDAQKAVDLAVQAQDEARAALAPKYAETIYSDANRLFGLAQSEFDAGNYKQAAESAQQSEARFRSAITAVPELRRAVEDKLAEISDAVTTAEQNVETARSQGFLTSEEINAVATSVDDLRSRLDGDLGVDMDVLNAFLEEAKGALPKSESLATAHLRPEAEQARDSVVAMMEEAQELNAPTAEPQLWSQITTLQMQLDSAERDGQWQQIIDVAAQMNEPLTQAITSAQRSAAGDIIADTQNQVTQAGQLNVQDVPGFTDLVTQAKDALQVGKDLLGQENFSGAIAAADEAKALLQQGYQTLGEQADVQLSVANENLNQAIQLQAETYAPAVVSQVRDAIASAQELKSQQRFAESYTAAQKAAQASANAPEAAKRGKAEQTLRKVEGPFGVLRSQGGDKYAPEAYEKALDAVKELRALMQAGQYAQVEEKVPAAVEIAESGLKSLGQSAKQYIGRAEQAITAAEKANAKDWVSMQFANSINMKSAAQGELEKNRFLVSIQKSEDAIEAAKSAESRAYQLQAEQNLRKANDLIAEARRAQQDDLSPNAYRKALYATEDGGEMLSKGSYQEAYKVSLDAAAKADRALNNIVLTAQESVDSLLFAEGVTYAQPETQQSAALLNDAQAAQAARNYPAANQAAAEAIRIAQSAEHFTWKQRTFSLLKNLEGAELMLQGENAQIETPALYRQTLDHFTEARVQQIDENYAESYKQAAGAEQTINQIWLAMESDLTRVKMEASQTADWLGENAEVEEGRELKMELMDSVSELERLIQLKEWRAAYAKADAVSKKADFAKGALQTQNRYRFREMLKETYKPFTEENALAITPDQKEMVENTIKTLRQPGDLTYAELVDAYEQAVAASETLPDEIAQQALQRTEEINVVLQQAQDAGGRTYFPDKFRELTSDLQWLRNAVEGDDYKMIANRLKKLEKEAPQMLQATQLAVEEDAYLTNLDGFLRDVNNLIHDFSAISSMPPNQLLAARTTEYKLDETATDMFKSLQSKLTTKAMRINAEILLERVKDLTPPHTLESVHKNAIKSFTYFLRSAEGFDIYGRSKIYDLGYREESLKQGYKYLLKAQTVNSDLAFAIETSRKMSKWDKFVRNLRRLEVKAWDSYYSWVIR
ncbi:MAG: hypothetical protein P9L94_13340 [Candidatus Hinthialibacter antarcticus]|nr:hypothetical protein [Candidatus Hinthialibacter antarcticus]